MTPDEAEALARFQDLFAEPFVARTLAADFFRHGRASAELRRDRAGRVVELMPIDPTTLHAGMGPDGYYWEQRIAGREPVRLVERDLLLIWRGSTGPRSRPLDMG